MEYKKGDTFYRTAIVFEPEKDFKTEFSVEEWVITSIIKGEVTMTEKIEYMTWSKHLNAWMSTIPNYHRKRFNVTEDILAKGFFKTKNESMIAILPIIKQKKTEFLRFINKVEKLKSGTKRKRKPNNHKWSGNA